MSYVLSDNPSPIETDLAALGFPHREIRKANELHNVFTLRDEIELCAEFHQSVKQGSEEDYGALKAQITSYINYMEATCNHAHFATDFLKNMVREGVLQPKDIDLDDIDDLEDDINDPISCAHLHLDPSAPRSSHEDEALPNSHSQ